MPKKKISPQLPLIAHYKKNHVNLWSNSLFGDVFLRHEIHRKFRNWNDDQSSGFELFLNEFKKISKKREHEDPSKWNERHTQDYWILPILRILGWDQTHLGADASYADNLNISVVENGNKKNYEPDLIFFDSPDERSFVLSKSKNEINLALSKFAKIIVESKRWNRLDDLKLGQIKRDSDEEKNDSAISLDPALQIVTYLNVVGGCDFGILTDGKTWQLYHSTESAENVKRVYEFKLNALKNWAVDTLDKDSEKKVYEQAKMFYFLFSKYAHTDGKEILANAIKQSRDFSNEIKDDLKIRFLSAMNIACNEFFDLGSKKQDLELIRRSAESLLFSVLFIRSCEIKHVLPLISPQYEEKFSLSKIIDSLDPNKTSYDPELTASLKVKYLKQYFGATFKLEEFTIYNRLLKLYSIIENGDYGLKISGFKESIFLQDEKDFVTNFKLNNSKMLEILFLLGFRAGVDDITNSKKFFQIPYDFFTPRELGSIYETFLEFKLEKADCNLYFNKKDKQWVELESISNEFLRNNNIEKSDVVFENRLYFRPCNKDRKMSGSYYTHDYIVRKIVESSVDRVTKNLTSDEVLEVTICDPSMGSGHFLNYSLLHLANSYRQKLANEKKLNETFFESCEKVVAKCIFGVDMNESAVKLSKLSFWLATSYPGKSLHSFKNQFRVADSLFVLDWKTEFGKVFKKGGFDIVVGNPPYGAELSSENKKLAKTKYTLGNSNTAVLFTELAFKISKPSAIVGYIFPKSFCFSSTWEKARDLVLPHMYELLNVGKAWKEVKLEQVIFMADKSSTFDSYKTFGRSQETFTFTDSIQKNELTKFGMVLCDTSNEEILLGSKILNRSLLFSQFYDSNTRGAVGLQKVLTKNKTKFKFIGGKEISRFEIDGVKDYLGTNKEIPSSSIIHKNSVLAQNLVAHIANPVDHTKIISMSCDEELKDTFICDTINQIVINKKYDSFLISTFLNSRFSNWYFYRFIVGKAIRTIHFDDPVTSKIPLPAKLFSQHVNEFSSLANQARKAYSQQKHEDYLEVCLKIDQLIYQSVGLSNADIELIESTMPNFVNFYGDYLSSKDKKIIELKLQLKVVQKVKGKLTKSRSKSVSA